MVVQGSKSNHKPSCERRTGQRYVDGPIRQDHRCPTCTSSYASELGRRCNADTQLVQIYYFDELFYLSAIALTKISILLFYLRIFPNRDFRRWVYGVLILCVLYIVTFIPLTIFQCLPIHQAWERWDGEHSGKCINLNVEGWISAALNIIFDLVVICLPLRELSKLAMSRRRKAGIMLMFLGGGL